MLSGLTLSTPWTVACQAPLSMGFPSKNTGVACHFLDLPSPDIKPACPSLAGRFFTTEPDCSNFQQHPFGVFFAGKKNL